MSAPVLPPQPRHWQKKALGAIAFIAITITTCIPNWGGIEIDFAQIAQNWRNGADRLALMFSPDWSVLTRTKEPMLETIAMSIIGAAISAAIALPLSLWAARPTNPSTWARTLVRGIVNVVRAVPDLVYATILVAMVGVGALPGIITLILFDIGIVVKLVSEAIDSADDSYMEAGRAAGGTQPQINRVTALPQTMPTFISQVIYSLELNVRISAVLGLVGAGGIGLLIDEVRGFYRYDALAAIVLELLVVIIALEVVSVSLRKRLR
ncbi:phosphonate ABC transporter, permease protein PhnE [Corynebacterium macginleyi]|uniref:Phosphonate ABC transporter, permease protein PhnE n=1 Tax=Corynebacterium macginleyi TaxID=38290 RepID=A0ABS1Y915_9CORY|nr:phosphonate ABC transporter, permease protein PhnE [Corynebacterium macginleyi]MBK4140265.1 phosphonate ABC transporter, permease protein PhnE [Corynebacterium macginleyi]MBK4141709.1 phosphonate ABC transporter, permease protein PhnE [Corynebacterium macginleyi]MBK4152800.1 phosphonate ABC transporter, permease protein PhnE [Corynebacterium macginleyi]MBK4156489.1 phosphonate ABC transporter, permease protein PhnE [Corynebacterium macginleyi]MBK4160754.1 phosphonate ABC transporter, permea